MKRMQYVSDEYLTNLSTEQVLDMSLKLDSMEGPQIAQLMNQADGQATQAVEKALPQIGKAIEEVAARIQQGGRLIYCGAGTSGRLGVLDASECPPTFGVSPSMVQGIIAGGDRALRHAIEGAEDDAPMGRKDIESLHPTPVDTVAAISASGFAPYCIGALEAAREMGALTLSICCNENARLSQYADIAMEAPTGPEVLSGSTRLKAGTATKMMLNMLSTGIMVRTGRVYQNLMVDMNASNQKLKGRALRILQRATGLAAEDAATLLDSAQGQVKTALVMHRAGCTKQQAQEALQRAEGWVSRAVTLLGEKV